ncbi:MAG: hypothetical protein R2713_17730 [Ilumatobacteraceae bacterium]
MAAADDPMVARDESTRALADELKQALVAKQEKELQLWYGDIDLATGVGRVIRALKLSSQPPKAGVRFPPELAAKLADAATASLTTDSPNDRWSAVLEAVAFSPVRSMVRPTAAPAEPGDELLATVKRLGPLLPEIAALFGVEVAAGAPAPKPLRPTKPAGATKKAAPPPKPPAPKAPPATETPATETPATEETDAPAAEEAPATEETEASAAEEAPATEEADAPSDEA